MVQAAVAGLPTAAAGWSRHAPERKSWGGKKTDKTNFPVRLFFRLKKISFNKID
jgi:hypothetical protein